MPSKKVRLFIVEGDTEETAFGLLLERLIESEAIDFDVFHSDIFGHARFGSGEDSVMRESNIFKRIDRVVTSHIERSDYGWKDLKDIVVLTDTDGCFVDDMYVIEDPSIDGVEYRQDTIVVPPNSTIKLRNRERSNNILKTVGRGKMVKRGREIPISVYYLSRNMEHALHGEAGNLTAMKKARLAREFSSRFKDEPQRFVEFMRDDLGQAESYEESWDYIRHGVHSLERGSNLHLLFEP